MDAAIDELLASLTESRRVHSLAVGRRLESVAHMLPEHLRQDAITAAYLHDVGYGYPVTGFHPIDGANFLESLGYSPVVCHAVAFHSASVVEADVRGLDLAAFDRFKATNVDALDTVDAFVWWADMTTGPNGELLTVDERLDEILSRYEPGSTVHTAISRAEPLIRTMVQRASGSM
ncbi:HD domain-containing protein [Nocardia sp. CA-107356]|uniref:HD domain-containing protein n=1 Tax=Nocardia sp. CA-107356 TaxID=3239972 RepID=UPI003D8D8BBD